MPSVQRIFIIPQFTEYVRGVYYPKLCHQNPKRGKIRQIDAVNRSKNVVGIGGGYYCEINSCFSVLLDKSGFVERFPEFSLFYRLFSPLDSEMICIFPYFYPCEESAREIREIFI